MIRASDSPWGESAKFVAGSGGAAKRSRFKSFLDPNFFHMNSYSRFTIKKVQKLRLKTLLRLIQMNSFDILAADHFDAKSSNLKRFRIKNSLSIKEAIVLLTEECR